MHGGYKGSIINVIVTAKILYLITSSDGRNFTMVGSKMSETDKIIKTLKHIHIKGVGACHPPIRLRRPQKTLKNTIVLQNDPIKYEIIKSTNIYP